MLGTALCVVLAIRVRRHTVRPCCEATYLAGLELTLVTAVAVLFSAISTPVLSALYTIGLYVVGPVDATTCARVSVEFPPGLHGLIGAIANVVPNLPLFNMRTLAAEGATTSLHAPRHRDRLRRALLRLRARARHRGLRAPGLQMTSIAA